MAGTTSPKAHLFSSWLRGQMIQNKLSQRALGKKIDPEQPERGRRQVVRHLAGEHFPNRRTRGVYLEAFGLEGDPFTDDEEDSEQAMYRDLREAKALLTRIERMVRS
jgi:hypothetical protein